MADHQYRVNFPGAAAYPANRPPSHPQPPFIQPIVAQIVPSSLSFDDSIIWAGARPQVNLPIRQTPQGQQYQVTTRQGLYPRTSQPAHVQHPTGAQRPRGQQNLWSPHTYSPANQNFVDNRELSFRRLRLQIDYLDVLATREVANAEITKEDLAEHVSLRLHLEEICRKAVAGFDQGIVPESVELKCFGSLSTTFATKSSDMDLMLVSPQSKPELSSPESEIPRLIEKVLLDAGHGAKLLTKTRVPIIKFYEKPAPDQVAKQRPNVSLLPGTDHSGPHGDLDGGATHPSISHGQFKESNVLPKANSCEGLTSTKRESTHIPAQIEAAIKPVVLPEVSKDDAPGTPDEHHTRLQEAFAEPVGTGIQCDINFSNHLALQNSHLLRCYSLCDPRVRCMVLFVKSWAKWRQINSAYHGTLSSYGYVLMVLHYLVNIAYPSVLPNLQLMPQAYSGKNSSDELIVDGCDVRFFRNEADIEHLQRQGAITSNQESLGSLLRGFFKYYAVQGYTSPKGGFRWTLDVLSLRVMGGLQSKKDKGWTGAKTDTTETTGHDGKMTRKNVRQRYLFAIEDPFEWKHNVARTVVHNGIVAIRDEFRRAHMLIQSGGEGEHLFAEAEQKLNLQHRILNSGHVPRPKAGKVESTKNKDHTGTVE